jgi:hypothetical protein
MSIAVVDTRPACAGATTLEERVKKAFTHVQTLWATGDENTRYLAAVEAARAETTDPVELALLERSSRLSMAVMRALAGDKVHLEDDLTDPDNKPLPLLGWWIEAKKQG